jgi:DNA-binding CsgD family transcriptional regulator
MSANPILDGFDFGPDVDPTHDPVFDPDANHGNPHSTAADDAFTGACAEGDPSAGSSSTTPSDELPPADRAWHLFCQGMNYSAIARELHVDRHTVGRYVKQIHDETQADRRADRSLALTRALDSLAQIQAKAWEQIARDEAHERVVWDLYVRAAAQEAQMKGSLAGGYSVRPPTFHARTTRLLTLILAAVREAARLELLYEEQAPARDGDDPDDAQKDHHFYVMMRRSDAEELARMQHQQASGAPVIDGATSASAGGAQASNAASAGEQSADAVLTTPEATSAESGDPATSSAPAFEVRDANGNIPIPHTHPQPDRRPDGTDDWYVHAATPLSPPGTLPTRPGQPPHRRRPWDRAR